MKSLFECKNVTKKLINRNKKRENSTSFTLKDIDFVIEPGEIVGVVGKNGCGKTTLIRTILGIYKLHGDVDKGSLRIQGYESYIQQAKYREKLSYVLADCPFNEIYKPMEIGELIGVYYPGFSLEGFKEKLIKWGIMTEGKNSDNKDIEDLSTGEKLKMQLAFARSHNSSLMVMDEPTGSLDEDFRNEFYQEIRDYVKDEKHSVLISSHIIEEIEEISDKILWIGKKNTEDGEEGIVRYFGTQEELKEKYRMIEADKSVIESIDTKYVVGMDVSDNHSQALLINDKEGLGKQILDQCRYADLKEIFYYVER